MTISPYSLIPCHSITMQLGVNVVFATPFPFPGCLSLRAMAEVCIFAHDTCSLALDMQTAHEPHVTGVAAATALQLRSGYLLYVLYPQHFVYLIQRSTQSHDLHLLYARVADPPMPRMRPGSPAEMMETSPTWRRMVSRTNPGVDVVLQTLRSGWVAISSWFR